MVTVLSFLSIMELNDAKNIQPPAQLGHWPAIALRYFENDEYSKAVDICRRKLKEEPASIAGRVILARSLYHAGQIENAHEHFLKVLCAESSHLVALKYLGDILFQENQQAGAMAYYRKIFEIDPYCGGLSCPMKPAAKVQTKRLTIKRDGENKPHKRKTPLQEPAFLTETVGDIYRDQGYMQLAGEVYRRLLKSNKNNRIEEKLKEVEQLTADKGRNL